MPKSSWRNKFFLIGEKVLQEDLGAYAVSFLSLERKDRKIVRVETFQLQTGEMICVDDRRVDHWGAWIWPSVLILPLFAKGSMLLDSAEVCSVAVLFTVCTVFMWKRLCSGWGTERELALCSWFLLYSAVYSVVIFSLLAENFLVSCFKIASREREDLLPTGIAGAKWQINLPWLCSFSSSLPWG